MVNIMPAKHLHVRWELLCMLKLEFIETVSWVGLRSLLLSWVEHTWPDVLSGLSLGLFLAIGVCNLVIFKNQHSTCNYFMRVNLMRKIISCSFPLKSVFVLPQHCLSIIWCCCSMSSYCTAPDTLAAMMVVWLTEEQPTNQPPKNSSTRCLQRGDKGV